MNVIYLFASNTILSNGAEQSTRSSFGAIKKAGFQTQNRVSLLSLNSDNESPISTEAYAFPSPTLTGETQIGFRVSQSEAMTLLLFDSYGSKIYETSFTPLVGYHKENINTAKLGFSLSSGVYYFLLKDKENNIISKGKFACIKGGK